MFAYRYLYFVSQTKTFFFEQTVTSDSIRRESLLFDFDYPTFLLFR